MKNYSIELKHDVKDPTVWTVIIFHRWFVFKKRIEAKWFISEESATSYLRLASEKYLQN